MAGLSIQTSIFGSRLRPLTHDVAQGGHDSGMRKTWFLALIPVAAVAAISAAGATTAAPTLSLAGRQPLVVRGTHFQPRERVRVTVYADETRTARVRASASGSFLVSFPGMVLVDRCTGLRVRAAGSQGSVALLKLPLPACLPAKNP